MNLFDKKLQKKKERALKRTLKPEPPDNFRRYRFELLDQKALAYKVKIRGVEHWLPISKVRIRKHPRGYWYCVDVPEWLVKQKNLPRD